MTQDNNFDLTIVGGGLVGMSLALALADQPLRIAMIEALPAKVQTAYDYDARPIALSLSSQRIFSALGVWEPIAHLAQPIQTVHISDKGHFGMTRIHAKQQQVPALGYVIEMPQLISVLLEEVNKKHQLTQFCPAKLTHFEKQQDHWQLNLATEQGEQAITTSLLVAADGVNSFIRNQLSIETEVIDYQHQAIVANVSLPQDHKNIAYERFCPTGPIAFLPMQKQRSGLVITFPAERAQAAIDLNDEKFLQLLQKQFGYRLGRLQKIGKRATYPLRSLVSKEQVREGLVLLGNAAHTLHPIAAQGFNLSLRDVACLAELIVKAKQRGQNIGDMHTLSRYQQLRASDQKRVLAFTNTLAHFFVDNDNVLSVLRNLGIVGLDLIPWAKDYLAKHSMGLLGQSSYLTRGLTLSEIISETA